MSAHLQRLAELILSEHFGDAVTSVGLVLIRTGRRPLRDVIKEARLKKDEVRRVGQQGVSGRAYASYAQSSFLLKIEIIYIILCANCSVL